MAYQLAHTIEPGQTIIDRTGSPRRITCRMTFPATGASEFYVESTCVLTVWPYENGGVAFVVEETAL